MNITNWQITTVKGSIDYWEVTVYYASAGGRAQIRAFFNGLFTGNEENYISINGKNYLYHDFEAISSTEAVLLLRRSFLDYDDIPCFIDWSTWTFSFPGVWTANSPDNAIAIGNKNFYTQGPFDLDDAPTSWALVAGFCSDTETTFSFKVEPTDAGSFGNYLKEELIRSLFNINNYVIINGKQYKITAAPTDVSNGQGIITVYKEEFSTQALCEDISSVAIVSNTDYVLIDQKDIFKEIILDEAIPTVDLKILYDFKSFNKDGTLKSISPTPSQDYSGHIVGSKSEFLGVAVEQYTLGVSGTGFFRSGLHGYTPDPEVSSIAYNPLKNTLFIGEDDAGTLDNKYTERNLDGTWIRTIFSDLPHTEGLCYMTGEYFAIASEQGTPKIYYSSFADDVTRFELSEMETITLDTAWGTSKGLEGIAFDESNNCFYGAREGPYSSSDRGVYQIDFDGTTTKLFGPIGIGDFAGLHYDRGLENFFILSEQDQAVYQTNREGTILSQKSIGPMTRPEGITFTSGLERMYIAGEPCEGGYWDSNISGYGCFDRKRYVKISNAEDLNSDDFTMIFSCNKKDFNPSTLFSNFGGYTNPSSGFALGLNSAGRLYYQTYEKPFLGNPKYDEMPSIHTLMYHPARENIYCVIGQAERGRISLGRYDFIEDSFDFEDKLITSDYFKYSNTWYLGTGEATATDNYNYDGCMDYFMYFSSALTNTQADKLGAGIYSAISGTSPITRLTEGEITGYDQTFTGITGVIGYNGSLSGTREIVYSGVSITGNPIYGTVTATGEDNLFILGDKFTGLYIKPDPISPTYKKIREYEKFYNLDHKFTQIFSQDYIFSGENVSAITGLTTGASGFYFTGYEDVYTGAEVTGYLYSGYHYEPLTGDSFLQLIRGVEPVLVDTDKIFTYWYDSCSYINQRYNEDGSDDIVEYALKDWTNHEFVEDNFLWMHDYSQLAGFGFSKDLQRPAFYFPFSFEAYRLLQSGKLNLFFNGVAQHQGRLRQLDTDDSLAKNTLITLDGDYSLVPADSQNFINDFFSGNTTGLSFKSSQINQDYVLFDFNQEGRRQRTVITDSSQWSDPATLGITGSDAQVFLNGIKLLSGVDYTVTADNYVSAISPVDEITGTLTTYPEFDEDEFNIQTGSGLYDIKGQFMGTSMFYLNGVRQDSSQFLYWPSGMSLITGVDHIVSGPLSTLYYKPYNPSFLSPNNSS